MMRGWYNLPCWNGLSAEQQRRLIEHGNLPFGYRPEGDCPNGAEVCIETMWDEAPGPRFYCRECAVAELAESSYTGADFEVRCELCGMRCHVTDGHRNYTFPAGYVGKGEIACRRDGHRWRNIRYPNLGAEYGRW